MNRALNMIGMSQKAGKTVSGEMCCLEAIKSKKAVLTILAEDSSDRTKKKFTNSCEFYEAELIIAFSKEELGNAIGKQMRASVSITDANLAQAIKKSWR